MQGNSEIKIPKKRLFIAIGLPEDLLERLSELQSELKKFAKDAKWVRPQGIHLTLKFLGYVDQKRLPEIIQNLSKIQASSFPIEVTGFGFFPNSRRPSVLWVGLHSNALIDLQHKVEDSMSELGFEKENRAFAPHLTLARFKNPKGLSSLSKIVEDRRDVTIGEFTAAHFELFESILHRDGAEYAILKSFELGKS